MHDAFVSLHPSTLARLNSPSQEPTIATLSSLFTQYTIDGGDGMIHHAHTSELDEFSRHRNRETERHLEMPIDSRMQQVLED